MIFAVFDCGQQVIGVRRRSRWSAAAVISCGSRPNVVAADACDLQLRCIMCTHEAYRYRIGVCIGLRQKICISVSVENSVLGLTLMTAYHDLCGIKGV